MKKFVYTPATPCYTTLQVGAEQKEISLFQNEVYELPAKSDFVKRMVAQGYLKIHKPLKTDKK